MIDWLLFNMVVGIVVFELDFFYFFLNELDVFIVD